MKISHVVTLNFHLTNDTKILARLEVDVLEKLCELN